MLVSDQHLIGSIAPELDTKFHEKGRKELSRAVRHICNHQDCHMLADISSCGGLLIDAAVSMYVLPLP
jgi:hypothetical protein